MGLSETHSTQQEPAMRVRVVLDLDIDPAAWKHEYGLVTNSQVRDDVRNHTEATITAQLGSLGLLTSTPS
jgi:hypothetical protein